MKFFGERGVALPRDQAFRFWRRSVSGDCFLYRQPARTWLETFVEGWALFFTLSDLWFPLLGCLLNEAKAEARAPWLPFGVFGGYIVAMKCIWAVGRKTSWMQRTNWIHAAADQICAVVGCRYWSESIQVIVKLQVTHWLSFSLTFALAITSVVPYCGNK